MSTTVIKNVDWAITWSAAGAKHVFERGIHIAFVDDRITHVGPGYRGAADTAIEGADLMVEFKWLQENDTAKRLKGDTYFLKAMLKF